MDKVLAVSAGVGQPLRPEDWEFLQDANLEVIKAILTALNSPQCTLHGLTVSIDGTNLLVSDGWIFDGEEVSYVPSAIFVNHGETLDDLTGGTSTWQLYVIQALTTGENRTFKDASTHDVWQYRRYEVGYAETIPSGGIKLNLLPILMELITDYVADHLPPAAAGIDIKERSVSFSSNDLDQFQILVPAPGAGKIIQVIALSCKNTVTTVLNAGTQQLFITYGEDITTPGIGSFPNAFLENLITAFADMVPHPDRMYENQAVTVGYSGETRPITGASIFKFNIIYKIIEF